MRCFTVLPDDRIIPGIQARLGEKPGLVILDGSPELIGFFPPKLQHLRPPTVEDGRVFECELDHLGTLADLDNTWPVVSQTNGSSDKALVVWRLPPNSQIVPRDNNVRKAAVARGERGSVSTVVAMLNTPDGFAALLLMEKGEIHMSSVGGGGPFAWMGLGGTGKSITWDGDTLRINNPANKSE